VGLNCNAVGAIAVLNHIQGIKMLRLSFILSAFLTLVAACTTTTGPAIGPDGLPLPQIYRISAADAADVQFRMLDGINSLRQASGAAPIIMDARLNAAAATHSRDMSVQNRPWHFGSDGSSALDRGVRVGYTGQILGETISETYETELETLAAWMQLADTREVILDRAASKMGFAWHQEANGKIWYTLVLGT
jgi:uncharacterized protein YkwD